MEPLFITLFIITSAGCIATYVGYPVLLFILARRFSYPVEKAAYYPSISLIVSAFNEELHIRDKLINTLGLDYPLEKLEIIVGSDGSSDRTAQIAREFEGRGVKVLDFQENRGKTALQNDCVDSARGEVIVFTDAASFLNREALGQIAANFADPKVGCVAGRLRFVDTDRNLTTQSQGLYWAYEVRMREMESRLGRVIGVDGPLYALRREDYVSLSDNVISDLMSPILVLAKGKKVVLEPLAIADEEPTLETAQEFRTRRRITLRALVGLAAHREILNPFLHPLLTSQVIFHKVLRWFVGPLIILNFLTTLLLIGHPFFRGVTALYGVFLLFAILGHFSQKLGIKVKALAVPYYFTLVNVAATLGVIDFFRKRQVISWRPVR